MLSATGTPGQFDDTTFNGVHEREIAHRPREQRAFSIARPAQKEGRRRKIHHSVDAQFVADNFQPRNPQPRRLRVLLRFPSVISLELVFLPLARLFAVAVVRLVVEDPDVL